MFLTCVDRETGSLSVMPYQGGFLQQPHKTMQAIEIIQGRFRERLNEEIDKIGRS